MRVEITITHENGLKTSHQYTVPNDNNVQLVCTNDNDNERTVYPIVQVPNLMGQSSLISSHYRCAGAAPGAGVYSEYMTKQLRDQMVGLVVEPNILIYPSACFFTSMTPILSQPNLTPSCYDPIIQPNSSNLSSFNDQVDKCSMPTESGEGVVEPERQHQKRDTYTCKRCGDMFEISQALAAHMNTHYRAEETIEERMVKQESKYKRRRASDKSRVEMSSSCTIVREYSGEINDTAAQELCKVNVENSNAKKACNDLEKSSENKAPNLEKEFKQEQKR